MYDRGILVEGGGLRGFFSAGILTELRRQNIYFPYSIGISSGSLNLVSFLAKSNENFDVLNLLQLLKRGNNPFQLRSLVDINAGIFNTDPYFAQLNSWQIQDTPSSMKTLHRIAAIDAQTASMHYWSLENPSVLSELSSYIKASCSIPVIMPQAIVQGEVFVDGGIKDSIPIQLALDDHVKKIVLILTREKNYVKQPQLIGMFLRRWLKPFPELKEAIKNRHKLYNAALKTVNKLEASGDVFVFRPDKQFIGRFEFNEKKAIKAYESGRAIAKERLLELEDFLAR